ncbi:hypothetical protein [Alkalihalobacillus sp. AL-G]|uniref:hypothetical protein n=1 Tax=Alkalihalobacillus sp. AL-G TaxID=2926399 RepID=UPI00272C438B|nr:hypothetical protein [Alkalihalobacillus sp. AL-G]WLD92432.1 hypothetical protein MOJ78_15615 [Alkalihalobacillus sp. AL-G]
MAKHRTKCLHGRFMKTVERGKKGKRSLWRVHTDGLEREKGKTLLMNNQRKDQSKIGSQSFCKLWKVGYNRQWNHCIRGIGDTHICIEA